MPHDSEQERLLEFLADNPAATLAAAARFMGISRGGAQHRIRKLIKNGRLAGEKRGRGMTYTVAGKTHEVKEAVPKRNLKKERNLDKVPGRTVKRPNRVKLFGRPVEFGGWAGILRTFFDEVYREDPKYLAVLIKHIPDKVVEGEANVKASWRPHEIAGTDIWVNTNMNSGDIVGLCEKALKILGLPRDCFELIYD